MDGLGYTGIYTMASRCQQPHTMNLLKHIPILGRDDPGLMKDILNLEHYYVSALCVLSQRGKQGKKKKVRSVWVRPYLTRSQSHGHYDNLMQELAEEDTVLYKNFM